MTPDTMTLPDLVCYALRRAVGMVEPEFALEFKALRERIEQGEVYVFDADDVEMLKAFQQNIQMEKDMSDFLKAINEVLKGAKKLGYSPIKKEDGTTIADEGDAEALRTSLTVWLTLHRTQNQPRPWTGT